MVAAEGLVEEEEEVGLEEEWEKEINTGKEYYCEIQERCIIVFV